MFVTAGTCLQSGTEGALPPEERGSSTDLTQRLHRGWNLYTASLFGDRKSCVAQRPPCLQTVFLHPVRTFPAALSLTSAGSQVLFVDLFVRTCVEPSLLSIRFPLCVLMYVNLGLVRLFCFHHVNNKKKLPGLPDTAAARGLQPTRAWFVVCGFQAQSIIKVFVLFHKKRQTFLFFLLISLRSVSHISAHRPEFWQRCVMQSLYGERAQVSQSALAW